MHIESNHIKENVHGIFKSLGLESACTGTLGLCQIDVIKKNCETECAYWSAKDSPCAKVVNANAAEKNLCGIFDPNSKLVQMGLATLTAKTCTALYSCDMAKLGSKCSKECAALRKKCEEKKVTLVWQ